MSPALYDEALRWEKDRGGVARLGPVMVQLSGHEVPVWALPQDLILIEYTPAVHVYQVQPFNDRRRDMDSAERMACDAYLRRVCGLEAC